MTVPSGVADITGYVLVAQEEHSGLTDALQTHRRDEHDGLSLLDCCLGSSDAYCHRDTLRSPRRTQDSICGSSAAHSSWRILI